MFNDTRRLTTNLDNCKRVISRIKNMTMRFQVSHIPCFYSPFSSLSLPPPPPLLLLQWLHEELLVVPEAPYPWVDQQRSDLLTTVKKVTHTCTHAHTHTHTHTQTHTHTNTHTHKHACKHAHSDVNPCVFIMLSSHPLFRTACYINQQCHRELRYTVSSFIHVSHSACSERQELTLLSTLPLTSFREPATTTKPYWRRRRHCLEKCRRWPKLSYTSSPHTHTYPSSDCQ